jgi:disulfide bond formation protein DsbB
VRITSRSGFLLGALVCGGLLGFALYLQYYRDLVPCPMCILQRMAYSGALLVFVVAAIHGPRGWLRHAYTTVLVLIMGAGATVAARQVWLQHLPADQVPACGPGLDFMLRKFPLWDALSRIFAGSGECAEAGWLFLGFSIAEWSLFWLIVLSAWAVYLSLRVDTRPA